MQCRLIADLWLQRTKGGKWVFPRPAFHNSFSASCIPPLESHSRRGILSKLILSCMYISSVVCVAHSGNAIDRQRSIFGTISQGNNVKTLSCVFFARIFPCTELNFPNLLTQGSRCLFLRPRRFPPLSPRSKFPPVSWSEHVWESGFTDWNTYRILKNLKNAGSLENYFGHNVEGCKLDVKTFAKSRAKCKK